MELPNVDQRFQSVFHDKRFNSIRQKQRKVNIDRRFYSMFTDDRFKLQYKIDKRGKPLHESSTENLKKYYRIPYKEKQKLKLERKNERNKLKNILNGKEELNKEENKSKEVEKINDDISNKSDESSNEFISSDEESDSEDEIDWARGEGNIESSSEEDDEYDEEIEMLADGGHNWDQLDDNAVRSDEVTNRMALCNMDWDRIKAIDLLVLFDGFKPIGSSITKVSIYPSDFGAKRLAEEERMGPAELLQGDDCFDDKEAQRFQNEKFREHQLNRLKYYYAVIECDSKETAGLIYKECDGIEYESSSSKLDLRFVPDDMTFEEHPPKDTADYLPDRDQYKPSNFVTTALNQAKVNLTWDETDHRRVRLMTRRFKEDELADMDMNDFIASSSEEEDEVSEEEDSNINTKETTRKIGSSSKTTDQDQIARYRSLLLGEMDGDADDEDDVDMEITWEPTLEELGEDEEKPLDSDEDSTKKDEESEEENKLEEKPKTKKKNKKRKCDEEPEADPKQVAELEMLMMDAEDTKLKHFDMNEIVKDEKMSKKKKRKLGKVKEEDNFKIDMEDSRFSAVFTSSEYAVDPNNPSFRKTKAMKELVEERQQRLHHTKDADEDAAPEDNLVVEERLMNDNLDINKLVNSIKTKTKKQFSKKKSKVCKSTK